MVFINAIFKSDLIIKAVLGFLLLLSVVNCAILLQKIKDFRYSKLRILAFEKRFWSGVKLEEFYTTNQQRLNASTVGKVFQAAMEEWSISDPYNNIVIMPQVKNDINGRIENATDAAMVEIEDRLRRNESFVTTSVAIAPFVGLLGTVWGIINCFSALSVASSASLSVLAPGIAEALITTGVGIFVSILAVIVSVVSKSSSMAIASMTEKFRLELLSVFSRELDMILASSRGGVKGSVSTVKK